MGNGTKDRLKLDRATADKKAGGRSRTLYGDTFGDKAESLFLKSLSWGLKADQMEKGTSLHIIIWNLFKPRLHLLVSHTCGGHIPTNHHTYWMYPNKYNVTVLFTTFIPLLSPFTPLDFFTLTIQYSGYEWSSEISGGTETVCLHIVCAGVAEMPRSSWCNTPGTYRKRTNNSLWESSYTTNRHSIIAKQADFETIKCLPHNVS